MTPVIRGPRNWEEERRLRVPPTRGDWGSGTVVGFYFPCEARASPSSFFATSSIVSESTILFCNPLIASWALVYRALSVVRYPRVASSVRQFAHGHEDLRWNAATIMMVGVQT